MSDAEALRRTEKLAQTPQIAIAGASGRIGSRLQYFMTPTFDTYPLKHINPVDDKTAKAVVSDFDIIDAQSTYHAVEQLASQGADTLVNSTGVLTVDASEAERGDPDGNMYRVHVVGAENLARACQSFGLDLVHLSTEYVFNGRKPYGETYAEDEQSDLDIDSSPTWYGLTKALGEQRVMETYPESVIVRVSQVQSPLGGLFLATLKQLQKGVPFTRGNNQFVSPITDRTLAYAIVMITRALRRGEAKPIYHVSPRDAFTSFNIALMLAEAYGLGEEARNLIQPITLEELVDLGEQKVLRPKNSVLSVEVFERDFGPGLLLSTQEEIETFRELYPAP